MNMFLLFLVFLGPALPVLIMGYEYIATRYVADDAVWGVV